MSRIRTIKPDAFKKRAVPLAVRREVALREGAIPGRTTSASCHYCGAPGSISWVWLKLDGTPSGWVAFSHELDHVVPEYLGGPSTAENIVLACRTCNRSKGTRDAPRDRGGAR